MANIDVENFMANLEQVMSSDNDFTVKQKEGLRSLHKKLGFLREFLRDSEEKQNDEHPELKKLLTQIRELMFKAENAIDLFAMKGVLRLQKVNRDISKFLTMEMKEIHEKPIKKKRKKEIHENTMYYDVGEVKNENTMYYDVGDVGEVKNENTMYYDVGEVKKAVSTSSSSRRSSGQSIPKIDVKTEEVGLDDETRRIIEQLGGNIVRKQGQLKFIPIVGPPGAGKTTLAMKVFNDRFSEERFKIRGWITVSQVHNKRQMLIGILKSTSIVKEGFEGMDDEELGEVLLRGLRDKRYLIVMDDIWSVQAWNDIQRSFTHGCVAGSTVIFTTRLTEVANGVADQDPPHRPLPLSKVHSWELLQIKVFGSKKDSCPSNLEKIGKDISDKCRGLPLAIVAIAGILIKINRTPESWKEVATSLSSIIARNQEVHMDTLALSYNHLPLPLKACFLYFGLFPEDYEIRVRKLTWLWVAEGFVKQSASGDKSLEAVAEDYFTDLVERNLITPTRKISNGTGIKACRIHDLLRELCLRKAEEDNFLRFVDEAGKIRSSLFFSSFSKHRRLGLNFQILDYDDLRTYAPNVRSLLLCEFDHHRKPKVDPHFAVGLELLRILDLPTSNNYFGFFPIDLHSLCSLVHLTYLEVELDYDTISPSISNLRNLQTLSISNSSLKDVINLPHEMWNMVNLRHMYIRGGRGAFHFEGKSLSDGPILGNLQTLYPLCPCKGCQTFLTRTPNLKMLGLEGRLVPHESGDLLFPEVEFLEHLETLCYYNNHFPGEFPSSPRSLLGLKFPAAVKKLTLFGLDLRWNEISVVLGTLPNLEVLKLRSRGPDDEPVWDTSEGEEGCFSKLKCLKLESNYLEEWNASFEDFQSLEILEMALFTYLKAIPSAFSELPLLHTIDLKHCSKTANDSARKIKEDRIQNTGDDSLRLRIKSDG